MICLGVGLFASILFGTPCNSMSISFTKLGNFSFIIFSKRFVIPGSLSSSGTPMMGICWNAWSCPRGCLHYPHVLGFFFLFVVLIACFLLPYAPYHWFDSWLHPLYCCFPINWSLFQLLYPSAWIFFYAVEVLTKFLEHPHNHCFEFFICRFLVSILFSSFSGVMICYFIWAMFLCLVVLAAFLCLFLCIR